MRYILFRFWPVFLPIILYLAWLAFARRKAGKKGETKPTFWDGPWWLPTSLTMALLIGCLLWLGLSADRIDGTYVPAKLENGQIIPSRVE